MTREQAIDTIKCLAWHSRPDEEDIEQAIKTLEQEPCEDCISRQEILDKWENTTPRGRTEFEQVIMMMSSVTPQPKMGHWIKFKNFENGYYHIKCSECGQYWSIDGHAKIFKYCFNCGAKQGECLWKS